MSAVTRAKTKEADDKPRKIKVSYLLPAELVRKLRIEAAERNTWPAVILAERIVAPAPKAARRDAG